MSAQRERVSAREVRSLVVGGTGATGRLLLAQLLERGGHVRAIVRSVERVPAAIRDHERLELIEASLLDLTPEDLARHAEGCDAVLCCLGHTLSFRGIFGPPWRLVTQAVKRLCAAVRANAREATAGADAAATPVRFVLMGSSGVRNGDLPEPVSVLQHVVLGLLRVLIPPHADNEQAARFLRTKVAADDPAIDWCVLRPDGLIDEDEVSPYALHASPTRSAIFDAGKVSRINVAHVMAELVTDDALWATWRGRMPVLYSHDAS